MFGTGKERAVLVAHRAVEEVVGKSGLGDDKLKVPNFPSSLVPVIKEAAEAFAEYQELVSTQKRIKLPWGQKEVYRDRIRQIETQLLCARKVIEAVRLGYEPYTIPDNFYVGLINERDMGRGVVIGLIFQAPMPAKIIDQYTGAQRTKLFDNFLVASPDRSIFRQVSSLACEPVLVGFVRMIPERILFFQKFIGYEDGATRRFAPGVKVNGGIGFLIAHWDLAKDRKASGLDF